MYSTRRMSFARMNRNSAALLWLDGGSKRRNRFSSVSQHLGYDMIVLYSYPQLFGVADNNGYGLKVFAFMRMAGLPFRHEHILDASRAPRGQLPYIVDEQETIGDSDAIVTHLTNNTGWLFTTPLLSRP